MMSEFREYSIAWAIVVSIGMVSFWLSQNQPAATVTLSPLSIALQPGESATITATAYDELGNVMGDAVIGWLPSEFDSSPHCVSVSRAVADGIIDPMKATVTAQVAGTCGVGALSVTHAGRLILHQTAVSVTVSEPVPSPTPAPTRDPCRLPNGKCKRGCVCR